MQQSRKRNSIRLVGPMLALAIGTGLGGCAGDFEEDYGAYYSSNSPNSSVPKRTTTIKPKIPLPDRALLEAPAEPDCGAPQNPKRPETTASIAKPSISEDAVGDPNAELAIRIKLEYERECYRQAEARMRDRLKQLQASTSQTVKAVKGSEPGPR